MAFFWGYTIGSGSGELADVIWKTMEPHHLLGLETFQPLMHTVLGTWSKGTLAPHEKTPEKLFLRAYFRELGMPEEVVNQAKVPWAGSIGIREDETVNDHMRATIEGSDHRWITEFTFPTPPAVALLFRQYELVRWLESHYKKKLDAAEISELSHRVCELNVAEETEARQRSRKERIKRLIPPFMVQAVRDIRR